VLREESQSSPWCRVGGGNIWVFGLAVLSLKLLCLAGDGKRECFSRQGLKTEVFALRSRAREDECASKDLIDNKSIVDNETPFYCTVFTSRGTDSNQRY
jgi:hypothetical protein